MAAGSACRQSSLSAADDILSPAASAHPCSSLIPCSISLEFACGVFPPAGCCGVSSDLIFSLSGGISSLELFLQRVGSANVSAVAVAGRPLTDSRNARLGLDQELEKRHQVRFLAPFLAIAGDPLVGVILDPLPHELDVVAGKELSGCNSRQ